MKRAFLIAAILAAGLPAASYAGSGVLYEGQLLFPHQMITLGCYYRTYMQFDGNLVTYGDDGTAIWASNTDGIGAYAEFRNSSLIVFNWAGEAVWSSNPPVYCPPPGIPCPTPRLEADNRGRLRIIRNTNILWTSVEAQPYQTLDCANHPESKTNVINGYDRPGSDYTSFQLAEPRWAWCANECAADVNCRSYAYVRPGVQAPNAVCWLKDGVPATVRNWDVISGRVFR
jgi:hypothetical protein